MIEFEIVESPDLDVIGHYQFHKNEVYLGKTLSDIGIRDPLLFDSHAFIEVVENNLIFHPQKEVSYYLLNGKRALTIRKLKTQDIIQIGNTKLKIISFKLTPIPTRKEILDKKLQSFIDNQDPRMKVIETLGELMK